MKSQNTNSGTAICCIDGRIQIPVINFLKRLWKVEWVDMVTEAAPEKILSDGNREESVLHLHEKIAESLAPQLDKRLAVVSHSGCDCSNVTDAERKAMVQKSVLVLRKEYQEVAVIGVWVDDKGIVSQL